MKRRTTRQIKAAFDLWKHLEHLRDIISVVPVPGHGGPERWTRERERLMPKFTKYPHEVQQAAKLAHALTKR